MPTTGSRSTNNQPTHAPLNAAQVFGISVFPLLGALLSLAGMATRDVFVLLAGCGAVGAATIALGSGRRLLDTLAAALRAATGPGK